MIAGPNVRYRNIMVSLTSVAHNIIVVLCCQNLIATGSFHREFITPVGTNWSKGSAKPLGEESLSMDLERHSKI